MSITRQKLAYLKKLIAPFAEEARFEQAQKALIASIKKENRARAEKFDRENAPDPLVIALESEKRANNAARNDRKSKKEVTSDIFVSGTSIAKAKAPPKTRE